MQDWQNNNPPFLNNAIQAVLDHGFGTRDWQVFYRTDLGARYLMFTTVPEIYHNQAAALSTLGVCINVFLDDIADQMGDRQLLKQAQNLILKNEPPSDSTLDAVKDIWEAYLEQIGKSPNFQIYQRLLFSEWEKLLGAMFYSVQVNSTAPCPYNLECAIEKLAANMHHVIKHVVDICYSPQWDPLHTKLALQLARKAQVVTRIGNWTKSWQQELSKTRDITSGVFAVAVDWGIFQRQELLNPSIPASSIIETIDQYLHPELAINAVQHLYQIAQNHIEEIATEPLYDAFIDRAIYCEALQHVIRDQAAGADENR
jgi:hypothetical protein